MSKARIQSDYQGVYVGLNVRLTADVIAARDAACSWLKLRARPEIHITLAYLGTLPSQHLADAITFMRGAKHVMPKALEVEPIRVVAVAQMYDVECEYISDRSRHKYMDRPRVAWWTVKPTKILDQLRERSFDLAYKFNASDAGRYTPDWQPHATIGAHTSDHWTSFIGTYHGGDSPEDGKCKIRTPVPSRLEIDRIHITNGATQPRSIGLAWDFRDRT